MTRIFYRTYINIAQYSFIYEDMHKMKLSIKKQASNEKKIHVMSIFSRRAFSSLVKIKGRVDGKVLSLNVKSYIT